jgi:hypothetical protein
VAYSDLAYYAYGAAAPREKVATYVREHGADGMRRALRGLMGLGATDPATQWANLVASYEWINAHPLADNASEDTKHVRAVLLAALVHAQAVLQSSTTTPAAKDAAFQAAVREYQTYRAAVGATEMPSKLALWLADLGLDIGKPLVKVAVLGAVALAGVIILPPLLRRAGGSKSW